MTSRSWLPPYGWSVRSGPERTVLFGWDWMRGAVSLMHGFVTLGLAVSWTGGAARGIALWSVASLAAAAGVGWRLVIDREGFLFARTWFGVPLAWRRHRVGSAVGVCFDAYAREGADEAEWVRLGEEPRASEFGMMPNAAAILEAIEQAVERHHGPRAPASAGVYR